ncbi:MAG: M24 family metallopeptidase [Candidatus Levybacteria bacterium]|nr:M24 family metallopeptidase [Candidatus Levybacteria bacterium]
MINIKTKEEIEAMAEGGKILSEVLHTVLAHIKPGVSELELDAVAEKLIYDRGAEVGFKKVPGYKYTVCVSTNDVVVHGVPTAYRFKEGDIIGIDCGVFYKGFHTDMAETIQVQNSKFPPKARLATDGKIQNDPPVNALHRQVQAGNENIKKFLEIGKHALNEAIKQAKTGSRIGNISKTIQEIVEGAGYSVVRSLVGHGVGRQLHEEPEVPGFLVKGDIDKTPLLRVGTTIAIEVIYNMGKPDVKYSTDDEWTIKSADGSLSGLFERTVAITKNGPLILTR